MKGIESMLQEIGRTLARHTRPNSRLRRFGHNFVAILMVVVLSVWQTPAGAFAAPEETADMATVEQVEGEQPEAADDAAEGADEEPAAEQEAADEAAAPRDDAVAANDTPPAAAAAEPEVAADEVGEEQTPEPETWEVVFDANGGTLVEGADDDPVEMTEGEKAKLPKKLYEREDYTFTGWNTVPDPDADNVEKDKALFVPEGVELRDLAYRYVVLTDDNATKAELKKAIETSDGDKIAVVAWSNDEDENARDKDDKERAIHACNLRPLVKDGTLKLYAQWKENPKDEAEDEAAAQPEGEAPDEGAGQPEEETEDEAADETQDEKPADEAQATDESSSTSATEDEQESLDGADYIEKQDVEAVDVQGEAAQSKTNAKRALRALSELDDEAAGEAADELFARAAAEPEETDVPRQGDGSSIESISAKWITADTVDNDDAALLYVRPSENEDQSVRLQVNYALSGEHNYNPGDVTITIPAAIFKDRAGNDYGTIVIPFPEDPSTRGDFNWKLVGDNYVLTNTKRMSAATKGYIQFAFGDMTPSQLVDMQESAPFNAYIEVVTHKGNTIALRSNSLTAQFDTEAKVTNVSKRVYGAPKRVNASEIPASQRIEGEDTYIKVDWYVWGQTQANTRYTLSQVDSIPADSVVATVDGEQLTEADVQGFVLNANSDDGRARAVSNAYTGAADGQTSYYYFSTAYPASQFKPDTDYTFHNNIRFTVTETDPAVTDPVNPNVQDPDPKLVTVANAYARTTWSYTDPKWVDPSGHFMVVKNGNDDKRQNNTPKFNYTHRTSYIGSYSDLHLWNNAYSSGWYGIYPSGMNDLQDEFEEHGADGGIRLSYTIDTIGYVMPWMFDESAYATDGANASRRSVNYTRPVTMTTKDTGVSIGRNGEKLQLGTDYTFVSIELPEDPYVYSGVPHNINPDGSFTAMDAGDGTFLYERDSNKANWPDIELQVERDGEWVHWATASWKSGSFVATLADGSTQSDRVIDVPSDITNFRTIVTLQNTSTDEQANTALQAAINYDVRPVIRLNSTQDLIDRIEAAFEKSNLPEMFVYNGTNMVANRADTGDEIVSIDRDGYDSVRGYTTDTMVYPTKSSKQSITDVDYENRYVTIHYSAKVEERSVINDRATYEQAVDDGRLLVETHGVWRDLLPKGAVPDLSTVKLRTGDTITDAYTIENYDQSGRTLLVVEADLTPVSEQYRSGDLYYYEDVPRISFDATYDFDAIIDYGDSIHNVIAFESSNDHIGTVPGYAGEPDDPDGGGNVSSSRAFASDDEKATMTNLDADRDDPSFVYAGATTKLDIISAARTSLSKDVMVNNDGYWSSGVYEDNPNATEAPDGTRRTVYEGGVYSYRLRMMSDADTISKDLVLYDSLEDFQAADGNDAMDIDAPRWQGTFTGVDTTQLQAQGCAPVVYYHVGNIQLSDEDDPEQGNATNMDLTNRDIWVPADEYTGDLADVKGVAVDAKKRTDGNDFELQPLESVFVVINMRAPSGDEARDLIHPEGETVHDQSDHAYNNAYLTCRSIDKDHPSEYDQENFVRKDYTKVGLAEYSYNVAKSWDDDNDRDGIRPQPDEAAGTYPDVQFRLYADGVATEHVVTLNADGTAVFEHIPYTDSEGNKIHYTVREDPEITGYTYSPTFTDDSVTIVNKHEPERTVVEGQKVWVGDEDNPDARPSSIEVRLYANGVYVKKQTVRPNDDGEWSYRFDNLFKYENGEEIAYTVDEVVTGKLESYTSELDGNNIVNTYHPYGDLMVKKAVVDTSTVSENAEFAFTFSFTRQVEGQEDPEPVTDELAYEILDADGNPVLDDEDNPITGTITRDERTVSIKGGQAIHVIDIPENVQYEVTEGQMPGFRQSAVSGETGTINPNQTAQASFVNTYSARGSINLNASKTLLNRELQRYQFRFELYQVDDEGAETLVRTAANDRPDDPVLREDGTVESSTAAVTFGALHYTQADADAQIAAGTPDEPKPYTYVMREVNQGKDGYTYTEQVYTVKVYVVDNGDGTLGITPVYTKTVQDDGLGGIVGMTHEEEVDAAVFTNEYKAEGEIVLRAWKDLQGRSLQDGEFTYELLDSEGKVIQTKTNTADGSIVFDAIKYTEADIGKEYDYGVREVAGSDSTVNYDDSVYGYHVQVLDNGDGTLGIVQGFASPVWGEAECPLCHGENSAASKALGDTSVISTQYPEFFEYYNNLYAALMAAGAEFPSGPGTITCPGSYPDVLSAFNAMLGYVGVETRATADHTVWMRVDVVGYGTPSFTIGYYCNECGGGGVCPVCGGTGEVTKDFSLTTIGTTTGGMTWQTWTSNLIATGSSAEVKFAQIYERLIEIGELTYGENGSGSYAPGGRYWYFRGMPYSQEHRVLSASYDGADPVLAGLFGIDSSTETHYAITGVPVFAGGHAGCVYNITAECGQSSPCTSCGGSGKTLAIVGWDVEGGELPVFTNTLKPGNLAITKLTTDAEDADPNQEFHFHVKLIGEGVPEGELTYAISAAAGQTADASANAASSQAQAAKAQAVDDETPADEADEPTDTAEADEAQTDAASNGDAKAQTDGQTDAQPAEQGGAASGALVALDALSSIFAPEKAYAAEGDIASGRFGFCPWVIDSEGVLTISPGQYSAQMPPDSSYYVERWSTSNIPWYNYRNQITKVVVEPGCKAGLTCRWLFYGLSNCTEIDVSGLDTSQCRSFQQMFRSCPKLETIAGISGFNTSNVTDMAMMFDGCSSLTEVDVSNFDTSRNTGFGSMFLNCSSLTSLDVSGFNTSNVTGFGMMFSGCSSLTSLDVSGFDTSQATHLNNMFENCSSLTELDVSGFETGNAKQYGHMFEGCSGLTSLDLSKFDASQATWMTDMFAGCSGLKQVNLGPNFSFKGSSITNSNMMALLPTPPSTAPYTGKWIRSDQAAGPYTAYELRNNFAPALAGEWVWDEVATNYTVTFSADASAGGSMAPVEFVAAEDATLPANKYSKPGYTFDHWVDEDGNTYADGATIPANTYAAKQNVALTAVFVPRNTTVNISNGEFDFTLFGGETATFADLPAGTAYQVYEETPDGWVLIEQVDTAGTIQPLQTANAQFTNRYQPGVATAQFSGTKTLDGQAAAAEAYSFTLTETTEGASGTVTMLVDGQEQEIELPYTVSTTEGGFVQFPVILYSADDVGEHAYEIVEVDPDDSAIDYDTHVETVKVTVSGDANALSATTVVDEDGDGKISFANTTRPGELQIRKIGQNVTRVNADDEFTFKVTLNNEKGLPLGEGSTIYWYKLDASGNVVASGEDASSQSQSQSQKNAPASAQAVAESADDAASTADVPASEAAPTPDRAAEILTAGPGLSPSATPQIARTTGAAEQADEQSGGDAAKSVAKAQGVSTAAGAVYHATEAELEGTAYAVITDDGEMIFFRSNESYSAGTDQTVTDIKGNTYHGEIFTDFENTTGYGMNARKTPWQDRMYDHVVTSVRIAEEQAIKPLSTSTWFLQGFNTVDTPLTSIDLSRLDTSNVTDMSYMFYNCQRLTSLDVSGFDTSKVTNFRGTFEGCWVLETLDVSGFDTASAMSMTAMFENCRKVTVLDVSGFDTSRVTSMDHMFENCYALTTLDVSGFNTSRVTTLQHTFSGCHSLTELDVSHFDTSHVVGNGTSGFWCTFADCRSLKRLDCSSFITSQCRHYNSMFYGCSSLVELDISNMDTRNADHTSGMFSGCSSLRRVVLGPNFRFRASQYSGILPLPPSASTTGKWVREDNTWGPYTREYLQNNYSSAMAGAWVWDILDTRGIVDFDANGGYTSARSITATSATQSIQMPGSSTTRKHYVLTGWNTKPDGSGKSYGPNETANDVVQLGSAVTLYAQWAQTDARDYTVRHYQQNSSLSGYSLVNTQTLEADKGTTVSPAVNTYAGFKKPEVQSAVVPDDDNLVIEYYYDRLTYQIAYDGNGATSGQMKNQNMVGAVSASLRPNVFQKEGAIFVGWNTAADGSSVSYADKQTVRDLASQDGSTVTLYAQWLSNDNPALEPSAGVIYVTCKPGETIVIPGLPDGTTYTVEEVDLPEGWSETSHSGEIGTIVANEVALGSFTNTYTAEGEITLLAHKALEGEELEDGQFSFELLNANMEVLQTAQNYELDTADEVADEDGEPTANAWKGTAPVEFSPLSFTQNDIGHSYTYYIREVAGSSAAYTYDEHIERVTVSVMDAGKGELSVVAAYDDDGALFTNGMSDAKLKISKTVENAPAGSENQEYAFTVDLKNAAGETLAGEYPAKRYTADYALEQKTTSVTKYSHMSNVDDAGNQLANYAHNASYNEVVTIPGATGLHVKIVYGGESANYDWACMWAGSHPNYTASSNYSNSDCVTGKLGGGSHTSASNTREYDVDGDTATFGFRSDYSYVGDGYGYYAVITADVEETVETGVEDLTVKAGDTVTLKDGEFIVISELPHNGLYTVTEDVQAPWKLVESTGAQGVLKADETAEASFTNTYDDTPPPPRVLSGEAQIAATKNVVNGVIADAEDFSFQLLDSTGAVIQVKGCDEAGAATSPITFDPIEYGTEDAGKTFTYQVREVAGADEEVTYDDTVYTVLVTVEDTGNDSLSTTVRYGHYQDASGDDPDAEDEFVEVDGGAVFTNTYPVPSSAELEFDKFLYGYPGDMADVSFNFTLTKTDAAGNPLQNSLLSPDAAYSATAQTTPFKDGAAKVSFRLPLLPAGDHYYLVEEDATDLEGVDTDGASYFVHVVVPEQGKATVTYELIVDGESYGEDSDPAFYNNWVGDVSFDEASMAYTELEDGRVMVYPEVQKYLNGSTAQLAGGDFSFTLKGEGVNRTATNDVSGKVAFFRESEMQGLVFDEPGTYTYTITENEPDDDVAVYYDDSVITMTVTVTKGEDGALAADVSYSGMSKGTAPAFYNEQDTEPYPPSNMLYVLVDKFKAGTHAYLPGAHLRVVDEYGDVVEEWTTDGAVHEMEEPLEPGGSYVLEETSAPDGYNVVANTKFTVSEDGRGIAITDKADSTELVTENRIALYDPKQPVEKVVTKVKTNKKTTTAKPGASTPQTGDALPFWFVPTLIGAAILALLLALWAKRRRDPVVRGAHVKR